MKVSACSNVSMSSDESHPRTATILAARRKSEAGGTPVFVLNLVSNRVFLIDSYEPCTTAEGVGPGVNLARAQEIYGVSDLEASDIGYFVTFQKKPGIQFLLDERDLPEPLQ